METLDKDVINIAKAIRQSESGGDFKAKGKSGEYGAYQFTPDTWKAQASKYGITVPIEQATPQQQNEVAYRKIKEWKDSGKNVGQVASMWNAGEAEPDAYTGKFGVTTKTHKAGDPSVGVNKFGAKYDVPAYAKSVATAYQTLKRGGQAGMDPKNPSAVQPDLTKDTIVASETPEAPSANTGLLGTNPNDSLYGKILDNKFSRLVAGAGNALSFGGAKQLGEQVGSSIAGITEKTKGLLGKEDNSKYIPEAQFGETVKGTGKVLGSVAGLALTGTRAGRGLIMKAIGKGPALESPEVVKILKASGATNREQAISRLTAYLRNAPIDKVGVGGKTEQMVLKAIQELNPTLVEKTSLVKKLIDVGWDWSKGALLYKAFGKDVGGIVDKVLP